MTLGADLSPRKLSQAEPDPVAFTIAGAIESTDISNPPPLETLTFGLGRTGSIDGSRLPRCERRTTAISRSLSQIKELCGNAIVGGGRIGFGIVFPGDRAIPAASRLVVFNGKGEGGRTTLFAVAEITSPIVTMAVIPIEIKGRFGSRNGTQMTLSVPKIAGGYGFVSDFRITLRRRLGPPNRTHGVAAFACPDNGLSLKARAIFPAGPPIRTELPLACQREAKLAN